MTTNQFDIKTLTVRGLFGYLDHEVEFSRSSAVTVLAGPNGCGKTHILRILRAFLEIDFASLIEIPYRSATLEFTNKKSITSERNVNDDKTTLKITAKEPRTKSQSFEVDSDQFQTDESGDLPSWISRVDRDKWYDERAGRYISPTQIERRYSVVVSSDKRRQEVVNRYPALRGLSNRSMPISIDTKRLDTQMRPTNRDEFYHYGTKATNRGAVGRIGQYTSEIRDQVSEARRKSLERSQEADEKFASTLLKRSRRSVKQESLVQAYARLSRLSEELSVNGLAGRAINVEIPSETNPTERRVLDLFLQDWERKLEPLLPVHRKLTALRRIVNAKFQGKTIGFDSRGAVVFRHVDGSDIQVEQLSSGEQHLIALFTLLLFSANSGSIVLIDEPEISLHAAWKHAFIDDIEEVAEISNLTIVMATHSTSIINGRWELVQELRGYSIDHQ